jgi:glutamine synthetase
MRSTTRSATAGQAEIDMKLQRRWSTWRTKVLTYKYIVKNVARRHGNRTATFMPKPIFGDNGSGMHTHVSASGRASEPLFAGDGYAGLSEAALSTRSAAC